MNKTGNKGIKRIINATKFSIDGIKATWQSEEAFRQEAVAAMILLPLSFWVAESVIEWILLVVTVLLLLLVEIVNSSIEAVVDRFGSDWHELSKKAKDAGSAAVSIAIAIAVLTWGAILFT